MKRRMAMLLALALCALAMLGGWTSASAEAVALLREARETGMELPSGSPGERLYLGVADVPGTVQTKLYLAFMAAPNGRSIRCVTLFGQALEVPREFGDPWLINSQTRSAEDQWIALDVADDIDLVFSFDEETAVYGLGIDDEGGHCRMVLSGHYENAGEGVDGDFRAEAELELRNITGHAAKVAADAPTAEQAKMDGMSLPTPGEGEALYLGAANVSQAEALYVAFVLSADGDTVKDLTVYAHNLNIEYRMGNARVTTTSSGYGTSVNNPLGVADTLEAGAVRLSQFAIYGDTAGGVLDYSFHAEKEDIDYPLDTAWVDFVRVEG